MHERKRKCSPLNPGETVLVKKCHTENILYPSLSPPKQPCFPTAQNLVEDVGINNGNFPSSQKIHLSSYAISNENHIDTRTTGCFPYQDVNYKPRICLMCVAGDSGHINHILR